MGFARSRASGVLQQRACVRPAPAVHVAVFSLATPSLSVHRGKSACSIRLSSAVRPGPSTDHKGSMPTALWIQFLISEMMHRVAPRFRGARCSRLRRRSGRSTFSAGIDAPAEVLEERLMLDAVAPATFPGTRTSMRCKWRRQRKRVRRTRDRGCHGRPHRGSCRPARSLR